MEAKGRRDGKQTHNRPKRLIRSVQSKYETLKDRHFQKIIKAATASLSEDDCDYYGAIHENILYWPI